MERKRVLFLGAGIFQLPFIKYLMEQGHEVIAASNRSEDPGMLVASKAVSLSVTDVDGLCAYAQAEKVDLALSCATELALPALCAINKDKNVGLPQADVIDLVSNKYELRRHLSEQRVRIPDFALAGEPEAAVMVQGNLEKPLYGSGSQGVRRHTRNGTTQAKLLEDFKQGEELGGDMIVLNGKLQFFQATRKRVNEDFVPFEHLLLDKPNSPVGLQEYLTQIVEALSLKSGIFNCDIIFDGDAYWLIDLGARMGGNCIPELIQYSTGISEYEILLSMALNQEISLSPKWSDSLYGVHIIGSQRDGILSTYNTGLLAELQQKGHLCEYSFRFYSGDAIERFDAGGKNAGYVLFKAETKEELAIIAKQIAEYPWLNLVP